MKAFKNSLGFHVNMIFFIGIIIMLSRYYFWFFLLFHPLFFFLNNFLFIMDDQVSLNQFSTSQLPLYSLQPCHFLSRRLNALPVADLIYSSCPGIFIVHFISPSQCLMEMIKASVNSLILASWI